MNESNQALWYVIRVALVCMMSVQIFGVYFNAVFPKEIVEIIYECNFEMKDHILTKPCTVKGEWND